MNGTADQSQVPLLQEHNGQKNGKDCKFGKLISGNSVEPKEGLPKNPDTSKYLFSVVWKATQNSKNSSNQKSPVISHTAADETLKMRMNTFISLEHSSFDTGAIEASLRERELLHGWVSFSQSQIKLQLREELPKNVLQAAILKTSMVKHGYDVEDQ